MKTKNLLRSLIVGAVLGIALLIPMTAQAIDIGIGVSAGGSDLCDDISYGDVLGCGYTEEVTDFTYYEGEFEAPDETGYDEGLTRATSAREFILNVTNFALSFLGLVAVVIIIYGGFLYVTAGGKEEQTEKGKKSVMYAVIGIIVVLSSYAIVNTLINEAAGGGEDRGEGGVYSSGDGVSGEQVDVYNINYVADSIQDIAEGYVEDFSSYYSINEYLEMIIDSDWPVIDNTDGAPEARLQSARDVSDHAEMVLDYVDEMYDLVDTYSDTYSAIQDLERYAMGIVDDADDYIYEYDGVNWVEDVFLVNSLPDSVMQYRGSMTDYGGQFLYQVWDAGEADFNEYIDDYEAQLADLQGLFEINSLEGRPVTLLDNINNQFDALVGNQGLFASGGAGRELEASSLKEAVDELGYLYSLVVDLQFVTVFIEASVSGVNAPAVVSFNGLGSYDPTDLTITDSQYHWDLDGDGNYDEGSNTDCLEENAATVSCIYRDTGTYRVGLRVSSQNDNVAPGQSYVSITVLPPTSKLSVTAITSVGDEIKLADYDQGISESQAKFTLEEGKAGITIDMDGTVDGNGDPTVYHKIDCGNGTEHEGETVLSEVCSYTEEGTYELTVEVADVLGNTDRYIGRMVIASPASRILIDKYTYAVNEKIFADGAASTTDVGSIVQYAWSANGSDIGNSDELEYSFDTPGKYAINLEVTDSSGERDSDDIQVTVESQAPIAKYEYEIPDPTQPGTVYFSAVDSYDPDPEDTISFEWDFGSIEHSFVEGTTKNSEEPIVKFEETGEVNVTLEVSDQYEDEDLKKTTVLEDTFELDSILDIAVDVPLGVAQQLDEGEVSIQFQATSENGTVFEIKYGDGEEDFAEKAAGNSTAFTHTYTETGVYVVEVSAFDDDDNENTAKKKVYIGESDAPIAVIDVLKDGNSVGDVEVSGSINTVFTFDAGESKNTDGSSRNLEYSWDFGDNSRSTQKTATHTFEETGTFEVTLVVTDEDESSIRAEDTFEVVVAEEPPEIKSMMYTITSSTLVTPVKVTAEVDAVDSDGKITNYLWYFYDVDNSSEKLGTQITTTSKASFTIPTRGSTGEENTYGLAVEVTDSGGNTVSSMDVFTESEIPTIEVENGLNESPVAEFTVSDTFIMLGDSTTLSSTSYDPDGDAISYVWDLEGDGFSNNQETTKATYVFTPDAVGCYKIRLKVIDSKDQADVATDSIEVCVEGIAAPPTAAFTYDVDKLSVDFTNNSEVDTENGASVYAYYWDFDTSTDTDGDGDPNNDIDSTEESPSYTYSESGAYKVSLTVYDNSGGSDTVDHAITLSETDPPTAGFTYTASNLDVNFTNTSKTSSGDITIVAYQWDFNTSVDSDGDGSKTNDVDSTEKSPSHRFEGYATYTVKLTVQDSEGQTDYVTQSVKLEQTQEDLIGYLTSSPAASQSDGKIHLSGDTGNVTFNYSTNRDSGEGVTCWMDKNLYYDTNGDGVKNNDHDLEQQNCTSGSFSNVSFEKSWGLIVVMLTVEDTAGNDYTVNKEIVFDSNMGGANVFPVSGTEGFVLMIVALSFALLGASIYTVKRIN